MKEQIKIVFSRSNPQQQFQCQNQTEDYFSFIRLIQRETNTNYNNQIVLS